jgi:hypothetical protein
MSINKLKGEALYQKLKLQREALVKKYQAAGAIDYDVAIGLRGVAAGSALITSGVAGLAGSRSASGLTLQTITYNSVVYNIEKPQAAFDPDAALGATAVETFIMPDFEQIKLYNIARGVTSGTMMDALAKFATGKVLELQPGSAAMGFGGLIIGEVPCLAKVMGDFRSIHARIVPGRINTAGGAQLGTVWGGGGANNTRDAVELSILQYRGKFKIKNYRGTPEMLNHPVSIWATPDKSGLAQQLLGVNSTIRMYGDSQVLDLNGFKLEQHERPARFAGFHSLVDLSNGHFSGLTSKSAKNFHVYCSKGTGTLGRNNHFSIRGHFVDTGLIDNLISGIEGSIAGGSYFGSTLLNKSSNVVVKDMQQKMVNRAVVLSSAGLVWYAQLVMQELVFGYFETSASWESDIVPGIKRKDMYPWLKWELLDAGQTDTFGNGRKSVYPVLKTEGELATALGANSAKAARVLGALSDAQVAYAKSMKHADDVYIQSHTAFSLNQATTAVAGATSPLTITHVTNGVAMNPANDEGFRYPDSVGYGFRIGSAGEGVGPLADVAFLDQAGQPRLERGVKNVHVMDSTYSAMHLSPMEAVSLGVAGKGLTKTFNGMHLRPFGYVNSLSKAQGIASSMLLMSKEAMEEASPGLRLESKTVDQFDTAAKAVANAPSAGWTAKTAHGLYKGNDIQEASLACLEAIALLKKYFATSPTSAPAALLAGVDNSAVDIGILALRRSMLNALSAKTAAHIGLKGGYNGDVWATDSAASGAGSIEIYPFFVSADGSVSKDKDTEWLVQQDGNTATPAQVKLNRKLSQGYLGVALPARADTIFRLKMIDATTMRLVKCDESDTPVTYQMCADLLDLTNASLSAPSDLSQIVEYKIARGIDGQNHRHKGAFGVRFDEAEECSVSNVRISDYETTDAGQPTQGLGSHEVQVSFGLEAEAEPETGVRDIRGVSINSCENISIEDIKIDASHAGDRIIGVEVRGKSEKVEIKGIIGDTLSGGEKAVVVRTVAGSLDLSVESVSASAISSDSPGKAVAVEIESERTKLK